MGPLATREAAARIAIGGPCARARRRSLIDATLAASAKAAHAACAVPGLRHLEWFHDHVQIGQMLFDGAPCAEDGFIKSDLSRPGIGLSFKTKDAEACAV